MTVQPGGSLTALNASIISGSSLGVVNDGSATFRNVTIAFNKLGGISNAGTLSLTNTIIAENGAPQCEGVAASTNVHNLSSDESCGAEKKNVSALLSAAFNDGGATLLRSLRPGSPAIDAGETAQCPSTDQRGATRPDVASTPCDIGADEYNNIPPVITVPAEIHAEATSTSGAVVTYAASATDSPDVVREFKCTPASGSTFPVGTTTVTCKAKSGHEATAEKSFTVTVTSPQVFYSNFVKLTTTHHGVVGWGPVKLSAPALETEIECIQVAFGSAWNEGTVPSGHGEILGFSASGNGTATGTGLSRECKFKKGTSSVEAWATDETSLAGGPRTSATKLTVPWDIELRCGEREAEQVPIIRLGVPSGTTPTPACQSEAAEAAEITKEETERKGCYATTVPAGCVKVNVVQPSLGLETEFEGTLRPTAVNGFGSGLNASTWKFEGAKSGALHLSTTFTTKGRRRAKSRTSGSRTPNSSRPTVERAKTPMEQERGRAQRPRFLVGSPHATRDHAVNVGDDAVKTLAERRGAMVDIHAGHLRRR